MGTFEPPPFYPLIESVNVSTELFDSLYDRPRNRWTWANVAGEPNDENRAQMEAAIAGFPDTQLETREEWIEREDADFNEFISFLYVMLTLAVFVSIFGMINTLVLSVYERTREIGMLRAIGMTRRQVRRMIRQESIITALIGAAIGLPLGIFLAALVNTALSEYHIRFAIPWVQLHRADDRRDRHRDPGGDHAGAARREAEPARSNRLRVAWRRGPLRHQGAPEPQAAHRAHGGRDRPRRRDDQRHVRPDRLDRPGVRADLQRHPRRLERRHLGEVGVRPLGRERCHRADLRRVAAPRGASAPGRRGCRGRCRLGVDAAHRRRRQGRRLRRCAEPRILDRESRLAVQPAHARRGLVARAESGDRGQGDRVQGGLRGRRGHRRPGRRPGAAARGLGDHAVLVRAHDRRSDAGRLRPPDSAATPPERGAAGRDRDCVEAEHDAAGAAPTGQRDPPTGHAGQNRAAGRRRRRRRHERVHHLPARVPARLRRHCALRRLVRHRELALDHDRAADP